MKLLSSTYFHVVLFILLYNMILILSLWNVVLLSMLNKVILTFSSVDKTLIYNHSNKSYWAVLSCGTAQYAVQGGSKF